MYKWKALKFLIYLDILAQRVNKLKKGEYIIVRDRLRPNMKEYNAKGEFTGVRYTESLMPAHSKEVYENIDLKSNASIPKVSLPVYVIQSL
jgi:hypothetical protein